MALAVGALTYLQRFDRPSPNSRPRHSRSSRSRADPTDLKPHPQENLPPLNFPGYPTARPPEVVRAAYKFAAEHPEVLSYVPCFCGCERSGHRGNEDCFVKARDVNGDVVEWDEHGMECAVCLDVATRSLQMHTSGASVARHPRGDRKGVHAAVDEPHADAGGAAQSLTDESGHLVIWLSGH